MEEADPFFEPYRRALEIIGNASKVAREVNVTPAAVLDRLKRGRRAPAEWCIALERLTHGLVTRQELRPDIYPPDEQAPGDAAQ